MQSGSLRCWVEWAILGFGLPLLIAGISKAIASTTVTQHGSIEARYVWSLVGGIVAEWLVVLGVLSIAKRRGQSTKDFGTWGVGTWKAWLLAIVVAGLSIASNLRFFGTMGIPISYAFVPRGFHLLAASSPE
jgi:hypothetical protein